MICAVALVATPPQSVSAASGEKYLAVPKFIQQQDQWCWNAATNSVIKYLFNITETQCNMANKMFNEGTCCQQPASTACNKPSNLWAIHFMLSTDYWPWIGSDVGGRLAWADVKEEVGTRGRPWLARIGWNGTSIGHMFVVRAYTWHDSGDKNIGVMDPWVGTYKWYSWPYFLDNSVFTWTDTLWKIHR
jgi:hypothetical protein